MTGVTQGRARLARLAAAAWLVCAPAAASAAAFGGVTNVKEVVNRTPHVILVWKEDRGKFLSHTIFRPSDYESTRDIPPGGVWTGDMWVPWADEKEQLFDHFMALSFKARNSTDYKHSFLIWQTGEYVRSVEYRLPGRFGPKHAEAAYVANAPRVPGEAQSGGERRVVVSMKGDKLVFTFEKYKP